jgi:4-hydroxy-3-polyprenylbenzoate decarboxylase
MTTLTEAGAIIIPASPSFYFNPSTIEELCMTISTRAVEHLGITTNHQEWQ